MNAFAGSGSPAWIDGPRIDAAFSCPSAIAQDGFGNLFIANTVNNVIRMITADGSVSTIAGSGAYGDSDGSGANANFKYPIGIAVGGPGLREDVYVADLYNHSVRKLTRPAVAGQAWTVETLAGTGTAGFYNGAGSVAQFNQPHGLVLDDDGNVYVADSQNHLIRKIDLNREVTTLAGPVDEVVPSFADGSAADARFNEPAALVFDSLGNLYVADRGNHRIRVLSTSGQVSTLAGDVAGFVDGIGSAATLQRAECAGDGWLRQSLCGRRNQPCDSQSNDSRRRGEHGRRFGSAGADNGNAEVARFNHPSGLLVDRVNIVGDLIVADFKNHQIRRVVVDPVSVAATVDGDGASLHTVLDASALGLDPN